MPTYADPTRCPDCRVVLPRDPQACPACSLPLTGATVVSLFTTLQEADRLLDVLRRQKRPVPVPASASTVTAPSGPTGPLLSGVEPYPAPRTMPNAAPTAPRLRGASVPKILLSLGALCLLVAAVTFLAVAWTWLGVGGRTVVLVALTGTALGLATAFASRGLRMAAESLSVVGLGLLALDVVGIRHAGWLGGVDDGGMTLLLGTVVAAGSLVMLVATSRKPLVAPAVIAPAAVLVAGLGAQLDVDALWPLAVTVALVLALGRLGTELPSAVLRVGALAIAGLTWSIFVVAALVLIWQGPGPLTVGHYVGDLTAWPLLLAVVLAAVAGPVTGTGRVVTLAGLATAGLTGSYALLMPLLDNQPSAETFGILAVSVAWVAAVLLLPSGLRVAAVVPLAGTVLVPFGTCVGLAGRAVAGLSVGAPFTQRWDVHVVLFHLPVTPLLLVPTLVTVAAAACAVVRLVRPMSAAAWALALGGAALLGGVTTLPLYDVPLVSVVGSVVAIAVVGVLAAERLRGTAADITRLVVLVLMAGAALAALPSDRITTAVLAVGCAMAGTLMFRSTTTGAVASLCFPLTFAGLVWAGGNVAGAYEDVRAVPVLLVVGALAIWRPRLELETSSVVAGLLASGAAIAGARDIDVALAVHLTVAGVLVTTTSIVHPSRRGLSWVGGLLLAAATWVRLYELGVHAPEAYTLPSALVLVAVGAWRLRTDEESATLTFLAPGLSLATVPSLLAALDDPSSPRALALGVACLVLALGGAAMRWSAPLVVGAAVGGMLVLRELAPYAAQVPSWVTIGISGALLLTVGITWESRMNDVRRASRYVAALR
ncbi:MAG: hypothetical protein QM747_08340 [Nocardioides sp.]